MGFDSVSDRHIDALYTGDGELIAAWLGMDLDDYYRHPVAGEGVVMAHVGDRLGLGAGTFMQEIGSIIEAWFDPGAATGGLVGE